MDLTIPFLLSVAAAVATNYLDWHNTVKLIAASGLAGEKNPVMRFFFGISKWVALAYKMWPYPTLVYYGCFRWRDVQNYGVQYGNAPLGQTDHWAIAFILTALFGAGAGLFGYLKSRGKK
jgi:hypothetical protein